MTRPRQPDPARATCRPRYQRPATTATTAAAAVASLAGMLLLAGCGDDPGGYSDADVTYASDITSHHAQTLQVLDLSLGRETLDPELGALADETRERLFAEVDDTQKWLKAHNQPVPETLLQHTHDDEKTYDTSIPGMLSAGQMHKLEKADDRDFQAAWLNALIAHEEGAVTLARAAVDDAQNAELAKTAEADVQHHEEQLAKLEDLARA